MIRRRRAPPRTRRLPIPMPGPRGLIYWVDPKGAAREYATGFPVLEPIYVANERIKIVIAAGGATKTGTFVIVVG